MRIRLHLSLALACTTLVLLATALPGRCAEPNESASTPATLIVIEENDYFAGTDEHYTNGTKLMWVSGDLKHYADDQRLPRFVLPFLGILPFVNSPGQQYNVALSLGQNMYTPTHTQVSLPLPNDRPYAGWTYFSLGLHAKTLSRRPWAWSAPPPKRPRPKTTSTPSSATPPAWAGATRSTTSRGSCSPGSAP